MLGGGSSRKAGIAARGSLPLQRAAHMEEATAAGRRSLSRVDSGRAPPLQLPRRLGDEAGACSSHTALTGRHAG